MHDPQLIELWFSQFIILNQIENSDSFGKFSKSTQHIRPLNAAPVVGY